MTVGVSTVCEVDPVFAKFLSHSIQRHINGDWGDLCQEDRDANDQALINGGRILSKYNSSLTIGRYPDTIWIITEADRSSTTVLFPHEY